MSRCSHFRSALWISCSGDKFDWIRDVNAFNYDTSIYLGIQTHLSFHYWKYSYFNRWFVPIMRQNNSFGEFKMQSKSASTNFNWEVWGKHYKSWQEPVTGEVKILISSRWSRTDLHVKFRTFHRHILIYSLFFHCIMTWYVFGRQIHLIVITLPRK